MFLYWVSQQLLCLTHNGYATNRFIWMDEWVRYLPRGATSPKHQCSPQKINLFWLQPTEIWGNKDTWSMNIPILCWQLVLPHSIFLFHAKIFVLTAVHIHNKRKFGIHLETIIFILCLRACFRQQCHLETASLCLLRRLGDYWGEEGNI